MADVSDIVTLMVSRYGRDLSVYEREFLRKVIVQRSELGCTGSMEDYLARLEASPAEAEDLASALVIEYSEFFRNPVTFAVLDQVVLPALVTQAGVSGRKEVRIWSAGCAAGQEPYSVAILLDNYIASCASPVSYRIFATDLNPVSLARAKKGNYPPTALRNVPFGFTETCFKRKNDLFTISDTIKRNIEFSRYDLLDPRSASPPSSIYGEFDLVCCCNVLIYYSQTSRRKILDKLMGAVAGHGYLVTGEVERELMAGNDFTCPFYPAPLFCKEGNGYGHSRNKVRQYHNMTGT